MFGCKNGIVKTGVLMSSYNIEQSKSLGVFKCEYIPSKKHIDIGNKEFDLEEVWVEHYWSYLNQKREIERRNSTRGLIKINGEEIEAGLVSYENNKSGVTDKKITLRSLNNQDTIEITFHGEKEESITLVRKQ